MATRAEVRGGTPKKTKLEQIGGLIEKKSIVVGVGALAIAPFFPPALAVAGWEGIQAVVAHEDKKDQERKRVNGEDQMREVRRSVAIRRGKPHVESLSLRQNENVVPLHRNRIAINSADEERVAA